MKTTWDLEQIVEKHDEKTLDIEIKNATKKVSDFAMKWEPTKEWVKDGDKVYRFITEYNELSEYIDKHLVLHTRYWGNRSSLDGLDPEPKKYLTKLSNVSSEIEKILFFVKKHLAKIPDSLRKEIVTSKRFSQYKHFLEMVWLHDRYVLTKKEEYILSKLSNSSYGDWVDVTSNELNKEKLKYLDDKGKKAEGNIQNILSQISSANEKTRKYAKTALKKFLKTKEDLATAELNAILETKKVEDELRGFKTAEASRLMDDDIEKEVIDALIDGVSAKFDISKRFYKLRAKVLKKKYLEYYDRLIPLQKSEKKYKYIQAMKIVLDVFENIDKRFSEIAKDAMQNGRVDVYPKEKKTGGAHCTYSSKSCPPFVLLNFSDRERDVLTLAHELGHSINHELMAESEMDINNGNSKAIAEISSTFFEDFVLREMYKDAKKKDVFYMLMAKLDDDISSIFRQVALYAFERELHSIYRGNNHISKEEIGNLFIKHMTSYTGDTIRFKPNEELGWVYWSHIRYFFYVYSYASGLLISKSLQNMIKNNKEEGVKNLKIMLSTGSSKSPSQLLQSIGIDITKPDFWSNSLELVEKDLIEAERLAKELKLI